MVDQLDEAAVEVAAARGVLELVARAVENGGADGVTADGLSAAVWSVRQSLHRAAVALDHAYASKR